MRGERHLVSLDTDRLPAPRQPSRPAGGVAVPPAAQLPRRVPDSADHPGSSARADVHVPPTPFSARNGKRIPAKEGWMTYAGSFRSLRGWAAATTPRAGWLLAGISTRNQSLASLKVGRRDRGVEAQP